MARMGPMRERTIKACFAHGEGSMDLGPKDLHKLKCPHEFEVY